jgi:hypothetical protein
MPERSMNEADTVGLIAELRQLCADLARRFAVSEAQLHRLIRDFAHPELHGPERSYQFKVEHESRAGALCAACAGRDQGLCRLQECGLDCGQKEKPRNIFNV